MGPVPLDLQQFYILRCAPYAFLSDDFGFWGIAERKTDSLLVQFGFSYGAVTAGLQEAHQFLIWFWNILKLLAVSHISHHAG